MMRLLISAILLFSSGAGAQSLFVGNAGEGRVQGTNIYLRDLYEAGAHLSPYMGETLDPEISRRVDKILELRSRKTLGGLSLDGDLLKLKLSDLNARYRNLGFYVLEAISAHEWHQSEFERIPGVDSKEDLILARRSVGRIWIDLGLWERLAPQHRIALIVHEAVASIQRLRCREDALSEPICEKNPVALRDLVGRLFSPPAADPEPLLRILASRLAIPSATIEVARPSVFEDVLKEIDRRCAQLPRSSKLSVVRNPYRVRRATYRRIYQGTILYREYTLRFEERPAHLSFSISPDRFRSDGSHCASRLLERFMDWYFETGLSTRDQ